MSASCTQPELNDRLIELLEGPGDAPLSAHAKSCEHCAHELQSMREGFSALGSLAAVAPPPSQVLERARLAGLGQAPAFAAAVAQTKVAWWPVAAGLLMAGLMVHWAGIQAGILNQLGAVIAMPLLVVAYVVGLRSALKGQGFTPTFAVLTALGLVAASTGQPEGGGTPWCLPIGAAVGTVPALMTVLALRRSGNSSSALQGAVAGAASGLLGLAVFRLHCSFGGLPHALLLHLPIVPLTAGIGFGLMRIIRPNPAQAAKR